jgi:hypothetical protein
MSAWVLPVVMVSGAWLALSLTLDSHRPWARETKGSD